MTGTSCLTGTSSMGMSSMGRTSQTTWGTMSESCHLRRRTGSTTRRHRLALERHLRPHRSQILPPRSGTLYTPQVPPPRSRRHSLCTNARRSTVRKTTEKTDCWKTEKTDCRTTEKTDCRTSPSPRSHRCHHRTEARAVHTQEASTSHYCTYTLLPP